MTMTNITVQHYKGKKDNNKKKKKKDVISHLSLYILFIIISKGSVQLAGRSVSNKGQIWGLAEDTGDEPIEKAGHNKHKKAGIGPSSELQPDPRPPWGYYPLQQHRHHQQHIQNQRLQRIEPRVPAQIRVSHHPQVEPEEAHEARVRDRMVQRQDRDDWLERHRHHWVLGEEEPPVLQPVEEGEEVGRGGDQAVRGRCGSVGARRPG